MRTGNRSVALPWPATALLLALSLVLAIAACSPSPPVVPPASVVATVPPAVASPTDSPAESPGASVAPATPSASTDPRLGKAIVTTPYGAAFAPHGVAFESATRGLVAGDSGATDRAVIGRSTDGGRTWSLLGFERPGLLDVAAAGGRAWAVMGCDPEGPADCQPSLVRSDDFGRTWHALPNARYLLPTFRDADHGWAVDRSTQGTNGRATIVATADGGITWHALGAPCPAGPEAPADLGILPGTAGWIVCAGDSAAGSQAKAVLATADDGVTWVVRSSVGFEGGTVGSLSLAGIVQAAALEPGGGGLIGTSHGTFRTKDGGRTWPELSFGDPESHTIEAIDYTSDRTGFALLTDFTIAVKVLLATDDGGTTWLRVAGWPFPG
jgi:photosystem II stability/assembly factor-like uncharacterized protein